MPQVTLTIAGRPYRVACGEGEEAHLQDLGQALDRKMELLKKSFGEIGDQRLTIMAAITFADDLSEANAKIARLEAEIAALRAAASEDAGGREAWSNGLADRLEEAATRIERVTAVLSGNRGEAPPPQD